MPWQICKHIEAKQNKMCREEEERKECNFQRKDKDLKCKIKKKNSSKHKKIHHNDLTLENNKNMNSRAQG